MMEGACRRQSGDTRSPGATGGTTPVNGFFTGDGAASICSFSGLNDEITTDGEMPEPTQTQSYGTLLVLVRTTAGVGTAEAKAILGESPGDSCNPTRAPFGNPKR